jgi:hypothetical protein
MAGFQLTLYGRIWVTPEGFIDAIFVHRVGETALLLSTWQLNIRECDQRKTPHAPSRSAKKGVEGI